MKDVWITPEDLQRLYSNYHQFLITEWSIPFFLTPEQETYEAFTIKIFNRIYQLAQVIEHFLNKEIIVAIVSPLRYTFKNIYVSSGRGKKRILASKASIETGTNEKYYILVPKEISETQYHEVKRMIRMIRENVEVLIDGFKEKLRY